MKIWLANLVECIASVFSMYVCVCVFACLCLNSANSNSNNNKLPKRLTNESRTKVDTEGDRDGVRGAKGGRLMCNGTQYLVLLFTKNCLCRCGSTVSVCLCVCVSFWACALR